MMNLNVQILSDELSECLQYCHIVSDYKERPLSHPTFYDSSSPLSSNYVYLIETADFYGLKACEGITFLIFGANEELAIPIELEDNDVLWAKPGYSDRQMLNTLENVYVKYSEWDHAMRQIVDSNGSLTELLECSMDIIKCNMMIHDKQFHVIAYKMVDYDQSFNDFYSLKEGDFFSSEQLKLVRDSFKQTYGSTDPYIIKEPHFCKWVDLPRDLSYNIFLSDGYLVRINFGCADGKSDIPDRCYSLIKILAYYVRLAYMLYPARIAAPNQGSMGVCLHKLINGMRLQRKEIESAAASLKWDYQVDNYCGFLILPLDEENKRMDLSKQASYSIINRAQTIVSDSIAVSHNDEVFILWNQSKDSDNTDLFFKKLDELAKENSLLVVKTHAFMGLRHVKPHFDEASTILKFLLSSQYRKGCYRIDGVTLGFMFSCLEEKILPNALIPGKLRRLIEYDNVKNSFLYSTIRAYIESDCSAADAAKKLYIERTALYYRLNKALEMLDMDLKDPDTQLQLRLSFKILDLESSKNGS